MRSLARAANSLSKAGVRALPTSFPLAYVPSAQKSSERVFRLRFCAGVARGDFFKKSFPIHYVLSYDWDSKLGVAKALLCEVPRKCIARTYDIDVEPAKLFHCCAAADPGRLCRLGVAEYRRPQRYGSENRDFV